MSIPNISGPAEVKVQETADDAALSKMYVNKVFFYIFHYYKCKSCTRF